MLLGNLMFENILMDCLSFEILCQVCVCISSCKSMYGSEANFLCCDQRALPTAVISYFPIILATAIACTVFAWLHVFRCLIFELTQHSVQLCRISHLVSIITFAGLACLWHKIQNPFPYFTFTTSLAFIKSTALMPVVHDGVHRCKR